MRKFAKCSDCGTLTDGLYEKKGKGYVHSSIRCEQVRKAKEARAKSKLSDITKLCDLLTPSGAKQA